MSFLGVKVILFLVIPLIIKEKSNASALRRFCLIFALFSLNFHLAFAKPSPCFRQTLTLLSPHYLFVFNKTRRVFCVLSTCAIRGIDTNYVLPYLVDII